MTNQLVFETPPGCDTVYSIAPRCGDASTLDILEAADEATYYAIMEHFHWREPPVYFFLHDTTHKGRSVADYIKEGNFQIVFCLWTEYAMRVSSQNRHAKV